METVLPQRSIDVFVSNEFDTDNPGEIFEEGIKDAVHLQQIIDSAKKQYKYFTCRKSETGDLCTLKEAIEYIK